MIVKRNGGKVILKGGKVSCSCCEAEECCMYAADGFEDTYEFEDLPDTLTTPNPDEPGTITYTKVSSFDGATAYTRTDPAPPAGAIRVAIGEFEGLPAWLVQEYFEDEWFTLLVGLCLVSPIFLDDQFADCYLLRSEFGETIQVLRVSLCLWLSANRSYWLANPETEAPSEWGSLEFDPANQRWRANFVPYNEGPKQGNQNIPTGDYGASPPLVELQVELCP